jgi:cell division protein ZapA
MAQVTIRINGYPYTVGCEDGEEPHLQAMVEQVEARITRIKAGGGQSGEGRLLAMAALLMADDIFERDKEVAELRGALARAANTRSGDGAPIAAPAPAEPKLARRLSKLAKRAEDIAVDLEHT